MRLSHSAKSFAHLYFSESQECFLDGHERAFAHFGGLPATIRYDNLTSAVRKVLLGRDRIENERFICFRSHWGFESFFCLPGISGAHEKGGIEGEVKRLRRNYFVPVPRGKNLFEINERLLAKINCDDLTRHVGHRPTNVESDFIYEKEFLSPLAREPFGTARILISKVDKKSTISVRACHYSVPVALMGRSVEVALFAERLDIFYQGQVVGSHDRLVVRGDSHMVLDHYLETFKIKPGAFPSSVPLDQARSNGSFTKEHEAFLHASKKALGDKAGVGEMVGVLLLSRRLPKDAVAAGITAALHLGSPRSNLVEIKARQYLEPKAIEPVINVPKVTLDPVDLSQYSCLLGSGDTL